MDRLMKLPFLHITISFYQFFGNFVLPTAVFVAVFRNTRLLILNIGNFIYYRIAVFSPLVALVFRLWPYQGHSIGHFVLYNRLTLKKHFYWTLSVLTSTKSYLMVKLQETMSTYITTCISTYCLFDGYLIGVRKKTKSNGHWVLAGLAKNKWPDISLIPASGQRLMAGLAGIWPYISRKSALTIKSIALFEKIGNQIGRTKQIIAEYGHYSSFLIAVLCTTFIEKAFYKMSYNPLKKALNPSQGHSIGHFVLDNHISYKRTVSRTVL